MICKATVEDLKSTEFLRLANMFYVESKLPGTFKRDVFQKTWLTFLEKKIGAIWFATTVESSVIHGAIGGLKHPDPYDGELVVQEMFWFVEPTERMGLDAVRLYKALEHWAIEQGAKRLNMACVCNKHMASVRKFYENRGFRPVDVSYFKELT